MKGSVLEVPLATLEEFGAVSQPVTDKLLNGVLSLMEVDIAIAVSGIAGPSGGTKEKPVGTVCFSWGTRTKFHSTSQHFTGDRGDIRSSSVIFAIQKLCEFLKDADTP